jgi:hypothetical protein
MTNATKKGKRPGKPLADSDKILKILTEARQVVDDLGGGTAAKSPPPEKKSAPPAPKSPPSRSTAATAEQPASRKKPAEKTTPSKKTTSPKKTSSTSAKAKKTTEAAPKPAPKPAAKAPGEPLLSPRECGITVLHALPGRIRFRVKSLQYDDDLARDMEATLAAIKGIAEVGASPATGSLLISYHSKKQVADPLGEAIKTWFPGLDTDSLLAELID